MAAYSPVLWILWDQDTIPSTVAEDRVKLVPKIPEVGKVYHDGRKISKRRVVAIVPERGRDIPEALVVYRPVNSFGEVREPQMLRLSLFWIGTPHLVN